MSNQKGNRNSFTYNAAGRETQQIDPLSRRATSTYDAALRQNLRIDARGNRTTFAFDAVDQLTGRRYPNGTRATSTSSLSPRPSCRRSSACIENG